MRLFMLRWPHSNSGACSATSEAGLSVAAVVMTSAGSSANSGSRSTGDVDDAFDTTRWPTASGDAELFDDPESSVVILATGAAGSGFGIGGTAALVVGRALYLASRMACMALTLLMVPA